MAGFCCAEEMAKGGEGYLLHYFLPTEVWAIALKPIVAHSSEGAGPSQGQKGEQASSEGSRVDYKLCLPRLGKTNSRDLLTARPPINRTRISTGKPVNRRCYKLRRTPLDSIRADLTILICQRLVENETKES